MTKDEIVRSLNVCADSKTCEGCSCKDENSFCKNKLMRVAAKVIESYAEERKDNVNTINRLRLDKETLLEMIDDKYTKKQLVQAVNDIFDDTTTMDLNSTSQSVGAFLRLIDADGFMAVLLDGTVEIRLNEE